MIGIGLIGAGRFGSQLGALLKDASGARLVAIYDQDAATREEASLHLNVPASTSYELLIRRTDVDAVIIATSHNTHCSLAVAAANAAKHVFCEKPMALTVRECREMIDAAKAAGVRLLIGHSLRMDPLVRRLLAEIDRRALGRPLAVEATRSGFQLRTGWWAKAAAYGGVLYSPAVHDIDLMNRVLGGRPTSIYAIEAPRVQRQIDYADTIFLQVTYKTGAIGSVVTSISDRGEPCESLRVICERGALLLTLGDSRSLAIESEREQNRIDADGVDPWASVRSELSNFVDLIEGRSEPFIDSEEALTAVEVCEAAYLSIKSKRPIALPL